MHIYICSILFEFDPYQTDNLSKPSRLDTLRFRFLWIQSSSIQILSIRHPSFHVPIDPILSDLDLSRFNTLESLAVDIALQQQRLALLCVEGCQLAVLTRCGFSFLEGCCLLFSSIDWLPTGRISFQEFFPSHKTYTLALDQTGPNPTLQRAHLNAFNNQANLGSR